MKVAKKVLLDNGVRFEFENGALLECAISDLPREIVERLAIHGLSQKVGDSYASSESVSMAFAAAGATWTNLLGGLWAVKSGNGGKIVEALARHTGKPHAECLEAFNKMDKDAKNDLRKHPAIKIALAEIEVGRAAKLSGTGGSDLNELF